MLLPEFEKTPGAIAIDLDGTLFNSRHGVSERNREAVLECVKRGIPVIIATSRSARSACYLCGPDIAASCSLIVLNGAIARATLPLKGNYGERLQSETARDIVKLVMEIEPALRVTVEVDGYIFGTNRPYDPDLFWRVNSATPEMVIPLGEALARGPAKIAMGGLNKDISRVAEAISGSFDGRVSLISSDHKTFYNIVSAGVSKPQALDKLLEGEETSLDEVLAFGDDMPDFEMLSVCGLPVSMANAIPEIKAISKYQTLSNDEDGVAVVLEKLLESLDR